MEHIVFEVGLALTLIAGAALLSARLRFSVVPFLILARHGRGPAYAKTGDRRPVVYPERSADRIYGLARDSVLAVLSRARVFARPLSQGQALDRSGWDDLHRPEFRAWAGE
jgi:hypothetical protein